ncbi:c6 zinc finger domain containing protein [Grosmannia clavigera kw1407]|uniref:C6 zinc finger domain containing protein n=1 Tax=Grosmannia clavigera (strain kw1407 / UAMH 11150) TaxID=655863 RepID=F0XBB0_GROCL|nr:c6 zinc finger domain containing protein [Grosmannia clavigera kw1407]EFX04863.1 c6 zinc finger domain containing protein [Grosmannia clavigera kw1407]
MRRQNRSCDQCRKAKRACDAPSLQGNGPIAAADGDALGEECLPCSYCVRTNKRCTLNWARTQRQVAEAALAARAPELHRPKRKRTASTDVHLNAVRLVVSSVSAPPLAEACDSFQDGDADPLSSLNLHAGMPYWATDHPFLAFRDTSMAVMDSNTPLMSLPTWNMPFNMPLQPHFDPIVPQPVLDDAAMWSIPMLLQTMQTAASQQSFVNVSAASSQATATSSVAASSESEPDRRRSSSATSAVSSSSLEQLLATRANGRAISANLLQIYHDVLEHNFSCWITEATCPYKGWRREGVRGSASSSRSSNRQQTVVGRPRPQELGPQWSNRIYLRVKQLDQMAEAAGLIDITAKQSQASQRALDLVIMAFATQWAQGSSRQREAYAANFAVAAEQGDAANLTPDEFDRHLQRTLWEQARQALQASADVESYRMVCAELIFGFVQRPWSETDVSAMLGFGCGVDAGSHPARPTAPPLFPSRTHFLARLEDVLARDGPPIFTERAARKMHSLKYRFDRHEARGRSRVAAKDRATVGLLYWLAVMIDTIQASVHERPVVLADEDSQHDAAKEDDEEDGEDEYEDEVLDDLSSGSSQSSEGRFVTSVGNQDGSNNCGFPISTGLGTGLGNSGFVSNGTCLGNSGFVSTTPNHSRWRIDLFIQDNPECQPAKRQRWPCSYDDASLTIARSAPVKVLLYRYVHYLQKLLRSRRHVRRAPERTTAATRAAVAVEDTVRETLLVYRYWDETYGAFYRDVVQHYGSVPSRIRGWSVCIAAHWHLAAIMLADVLEELDGRGYGIEAARAVRQVANTVATMRRSSAVQLSDLARMATPFGFAPEISNFSPELVPGFSPGFAAGFAPDCSPNFAPSCPPDSCAAPDFHFAVLEGTILTEPWSMLLIQAFSRAGILLLREYDGHQPRFRCEDCVRALWLLGKKSDMARTAATVLSRAMRVDV